MTARSDLSEAWMRPGMVITSHTVPWQQPNLLIFLRRAKGAQRFFWESDRTLTSFAAFGVAAALTGNGQQRFDQVRRSARHLFDRINPSKSTDLPSEMRAPRLIGGFSFRDVPVHPGNGNPDVWSKFNHFYFVLPKYVLTRKEGQAFLTVNVVHPEADEWAAQEALWDLPAPLDMPVLEDLPEAVSPAELMTEKRWQGLVETATGSIRAGRFAKIVLARSREFPSISNPITALVRLAGQYPDCWRFLIEPATGHAFFGATPELLVSLNGDNVSTMALAGSIRRGKSLEEDTELGKVLLASSKEQVEHEIVIRTIVDKLTGLLEDIKVEETALLRLSNIQHLHTEISGRRRNKASVLEFVEALHPTPAVGGLPSGPGLEFISQSEPVSRGWYAAPVGWFDPSGNGEFVVALRSAVTDGIRTRLYAGAGIVAESDPAREWQEIDLKFRPMMEAVGCLV